MDQEKIGKFIAQCRKEKNITQEQLANELGINYKSVSRWENGKNMPDYSILNELCSILDINVNEFLCGEKIGKNKTQTHSIENLDVILKEYYKMKKQRNIFKISALILSCVVLILGIAGSILWLFNAQYNSKGISHFLVVTIDETQHREYIGELDGHRIYVEKLNLDETYFINVVDAENISIKKALEEKLVSIKDWKKHANKVNKEGDAEVLRFENYEIACAYNDCIIRPLTNN